MLERNVHLGAIASWFRLDNCERHLAFAKSMANFKVIVIGGGLAGCLLANGLLQHDIDFTLYESDLEDAKREGYQIRLGAPALEGFKACMTESQRKQLYPLFGRSGGLLSSAPITYDIHMNPLLDLTKFPAYTKSAPINRILLLKALSEPVVAANRLQYGKRFSSYQTIQDASGTRVRAVFEDGTSDVCDLLISAEGSRSKVCPSDILFVLVSSADPVHRSTGRSD